MTDSSEYWGFKCTCPDSGVAEDLVDLACAKYNTTVAYPHRYRPGQYTTMVIFKSRPTGQPDIGIVGDDSIIARYNRLLEISWEKMLEILSK